MPGLRLADSIPQGISAETDDPVDDIRVDFVGGARACIQAKHSLSLEKGANSPFAGVVAQWRKALPASELDPDRDRLILAVDRLTGPLRLLESGLERRRKTLTGELTKGEQDMLSILDDHLDGVSNDDKVLLAKVAVITEIGVMREDGPHRQTAVSLLDGLVVEQGYGDAAWTALRPGVQDLGVRRLGNTIAEWVDVLRKAKLPLLSDAQGSVAARFEASRGALLEFRKSVADRARTIDLITVGKRTPGARVLSRPSVP